MSHEYNIRDFRNAGSAGENAGDKKSSRTFYACMAAIPIIAVVAGLSYKPLMERRGQNIAAVQQAELEMEAQRRAENPLYALMNAPKNEDGLIDSNTVFTSTRTPSPEAKLRRDIVKRALTPQEYLGRVDAKAHNFSELQMETLKYERVVRALTTCRHHDLKSFYMRQNKAQYQKLQAVLSEVKTAKSAKQAKQTEKAQAHFNQMKNIETKGQALAFVASGGAARHMDAIGGFGALSSLAGDAALHKIRKRQQGFNSRGCAQIRTIVQSGTMRIKPDVRLK